jgi:hypothetical protein
MLFFGCLAPGNCSLQLQVGVRSCLMVYCQYWRFLFVDDFCLALSYALSPGKGACTLELLKWRGLRGVEN